MLVVWVVGHVLGFGAVPHDSVRPSTLRETSRGIEVQRERPGGRRGTVRLFSGVGSVSSFLDGLDECWDVSVALDTYLFGVLIGGRVSHTTDLSKRVFDFLFTMATGHSLNRDGRGHTMIDRGRLSYADFPFESSACNECQI